MLGHIARKRDDRGFGFIRNGYPNEPGLREWFFHSRDCDPKNPFVSLQLYDLVEFESLTPEPPEGPRAVQVVRIEQAA